MMKTSCHTHFQSPSVARFCAGFRSLVGHRTLPDEEDMLEDRIKELAQLEEVRALVADLLGEHVHRLEQPDKVR